MVEESIKGSRSGVWGGRSVFESVVEFLFVAQGQQRILGVLLTHDGLPQKLSRRDWLFMTYSNRFTYFGHFYGLSFPFNAIFPHLSFE